MQNPDQPHEFQPQPLADERVIGDLVTTVEAHLPAMMEELADFIGKTAPRVSARERQRLRGRLKRKMRVLIPAFAELQAVGAAPDSAEKWDKVKTAIRGILIELAAPPRIRKSPDVDRLDWLVAMAAKATKLPRGAWARQPPYVAARAHLWNTLISVYCKVPSAAVQACPRRLGRRQPITGATSTPCGCSPLPPGVFASSPRSESATMRPLICKMNICAPPMCSSSNYAC